MKNWYREALEALGMTGRASAINNKLNAVAAHTKDPVLRELARDMVSQLAASGPKGERHTSLRASHSIKSERLERHCLAHENDPGQ